MSYFHGVIVLCMLALFQAAFKAQAEPIRITNNNNSNKYAETQVANDFGSCTEQLNKYRRFLMQAIVNFEDVCDSYLARPSTLGYEDAYPNSSQLRASDDNFVQYFNNYQPPDGRTDNWAFFKLLMAQFNDADFSNNVHDAVIKRCRIKSLQLEEKRNSVVLGKKQRFHSWGGKRTILLSNPYEKYYNEVPLDDEYLLWKKSAPKYANKM